MDVFLYWWMVKGELFFYELMNVSDTFTSRDLTLKLNMHFILYSTIHPLVRQVLLQLFA